MHTSFQCEQLAILFKQQYKKYIKNKKMLYIKFISSQCIHNGKHIPTYYIKLVCIMLQLRLIYVYNTLFINDNHSNIINVMNEEQVHIH